MMPEPAVQGRRITPALGVSVRSRVSGDVPPTVTTVVQRVVRPTSAPKFSTKRNHVPQEQTAAASIVQPPHAKPGTRTACCVPAAMLLQSSKVAPGFADRPILSAWPQKQTNQNGIQDPLRPKDRNTSTRDSSKVGRQTSRRSFLPEKLIVNPAALGQKQGNVGSWSTDDT